MAGDIPEKDWKVFRDLRTVALQRFCDKILTEARAEIDKPGKSSHEKYLSIYKLIHRRDKELANAFDDFRRSTALTQIGIIHQMGLLRPEELQQFSPETLKIISLFAPAPES